MADYGINDRILLIPTGGTIGAESYGDPHMPPAFVNTIQDQSSLIADTLNAMDGGRIDIYRWLHRQENRYVKDSKGFTAQDLADIAEIIRNDDRHLFIITHGTDAMVENAQVIKELLEDSHKTVIFTGAMVPLSMQRTHGGDSLDNLQYTIDHIARQKPGVYVVGIDEKTERRKFFDPESVVKDFERACRSSH